MGRYVQKTGTAVSGDELKAAEAQQRTLRARAADEKRRSILRLVRAGLSDNQVADRLGVKKKLVTQCREEADVKANPIGGALD